MDLIEQKAIAAQQNELKQLVAENNKYLCELEV